MDDWEGEDQFLIRVPLDVADELRERIRTNNFKRFKMSVEGDNKATLNVGKRTLHGKMCMPPTYIESLKTNDSKSYFKSADICQMAVFKETVDEANCIPVQLNSGITPAAQRIRRRRAHRNPMGFEVSAVRDVETAMMQTINQTDGAVTYETVEVTDDEATDDEHPAASDAQPPKKKSKKKHKHSSEPTDGAALSSATGATAAAAAEKRDSGAALSNATGATGVTGGASNQADDAASLGDLSIGAGDVGSDEEEEEEDILEGDDAFAAEFEEPGLFDDDDDDDDDDNKSRASGATNAETSDDGGDSDDSGDSDDEAEQQLEKQRKTLREEIVRVDAAAVEAQANVAQAANPIIAQRFDDELTILMDKKKQLDSELAALSAK